MNLFALGFAVVAAGGRGCRSLATLCFFTAEKEIEGKRGNDREREGKKGGKKEERKRISVCLVYGI